MSPKKRGTSWNSILSSSFDTENELLYERTATKVAHEIKLDESLAYYGLYTTTQVSLLDNHHEKFQSIKSNASPSSASLNEQHTMIINDKECITLYNNGNVFCIHFKSKARACEWYKNLFSGAGGGWTCFESICSFSDVVVDVERDPRYYSISTGLNRSSVFGSMLKKIIGK